MPIDRPLAAAGNPESLQNVESFHASPEHVGSSIQAQLSHPQDIASANQFFRPTGGADQFLPTMGDVMPPGGDMAALGGAPGVMPGAEQLSPLINMIMKMPGHIGLASSFFEALGAFFAPMGEMMGNIAEGFDLGGLFDGAGDLLGDALEEGGDTIAADPSLLPKDAPIFDTLDGSGFQPEDARSLGDGAPYLSDAFNNAPRLEVGGETSHPVFEMAPSTHGLQWDNTNYIAMEPNQGFGATTGNFNATPQPTAAPQSAPTVDWHRDAMSGSARNHLLGDPTGGAGSDAGKGMETQFGSPENQMANAADGADKAAEVQAPETTNYTVHKGDNLWDIARSHLGDGTRWEEIYDLNKSVLGDNPRLIMPGTELQLPGGDHIASSVADYTVKPGDNLWDISKDHLGGGQNWHELYQANHDVVGSNPDLIHPGQHLQLDGAHGQAMGHDVSHGHNLAHNAGHGHSGHAAHGAGGAHHQVAHNAGHSPAHGTSHPAAHSTNVAQAKPVPSGGAELQAKPQSLSSIQSYGDTSMHDSATGVPNRQL